MKTTCRSIEPNGKFTDLAESAALEAWRGGQGEYWIDTQVEGQEELVTWLGTLGLEEDIVAAFKAADSTGRVLPTEKAVFFEYPVTSLGDNELPVLFACLCLEGLVVTMHDRPINIEHRESVIRLVRLREPNTSGLVCGLVMLQSSRLRRTALSLRDRSRELTAAMDVDPESVPLESILDLKRKLMDVDRMVDEQMAVFDVLGTLDKPQLNLVGLAESFHLAVGNVQAADRRLERLDRLVMGLQQRYESLQQDRINRRLGVLTIISAIFMPLTFIAGVYGMNFDLMPELHLKFGYPIALGGMALIAGGLYWYFRSRNWLE